MVVRLTYRRIGVTHLVTMSQTPTGPSGEISAPALLPVAGLKLSTTVAVLWTIFGGDAHRWSCHVIPWWQSEQLWTITDPQSHQTM
jgi:hypothetical protein